MYKKISGFSDEISSDISVQFETLNKLGISYFEPRGVNGENISRLNDSQLSDLKSAMAKYSIKVSSIGSPIGKVKLSDDFDAHFEAFKKTVAIAKALDTKYIRMFSFYHDGGEWTKEEEDEVISRLSKMIEYAKSEGIVLLHENEKDIFGDTKERCRLLMDRLYCDNFKAVFDPANFIQCNQDTKEAFKLMKPYIEYMHIKDAFSKNGHVVPAGMGDGNVEFILSELFKDGYDGFLSLEPHLGGFDGLAELEKDGKFMSDLSDSDEDKFILAYNSLCDVLNRIL